MVKFISKLQVNYAFHILSVAKCGYDNDYGRKYRSLYDEKDLEVFAENRADLTIKGGSHVGSLLWIPSGICMGPEDTYGFMTESIRQVEQDIFNIPVYDWTQKETVLKILEVYKKYFPRYAYEIWPQEQREINNYIKRLKPLLEKNQFAQKAEEMIGIYPIDDFVASFVLSISGGVEGIFIGPTDDIFSVNEDLDSKVRFIAHEYIVYLLEKAVPAPENWWLDKKTYYAREGLAEFYMQEILGPGNSFNEMQNYIDFYKEKSNEGEFSPAELFAMGKEI